jgi:hypothetical protein
MNHSSILHLLQTLQDTGDPPAPAPQSGIEQLEELCCSPKYNPDSPPYVEPSESEPSMKWTHQDSEMDHVVKTLAKLQKDVLYLTRVAHATNHCVRDMMNVVQKSMNSKENPKEFRL